MLSSKVIDELTTWRVRKEPNRIVDVRVSIEAKSFKEFLNCFRSLPDLRPEALDQIARSRMAIGLNVHVKCVSIKINCMAHGSSPARLFLEQSGQ